MPILFLFISLTLEKYCNISWWHHERKTFFASLALCEGNSPVTGEFPTQRASDAKKVFLSWCHHEILQYFSSVSEMNKNNMGITRIHLVTIILQNKTKHNLRVYKFSGLYFTNRHPPHNAITEGVTSKWLPRIAVALHMSWHNKSFLMGRLVHLRVPVDMTNWRF